MQAFVWRTGTLATTKMFLMTCSHAVTLLILPIRVLLYSKELSHLQFILQNNSVSAIVLFLQSVSREQSSGNSFSGATA